MRKSVKLQLPEESHRWAGRTGDPDAADAADDAEEINAEEINAA